MVENFENLLEESLKKQKSFEGTVVHGKVISIDSSHLLIDAGLKSEGRVSIEELKFTDKDKEFKIGDKIDVYVERLEDKNGEPVLSREKARKEEAYKEFDKIYKDNRGVNKYSYLYSPLTNLSLLNIFLIKLIVDSAVRILLTYLWIIYNLKFLSK